MTIARSGSGPVGWVMIVASTCVLLMVFRAALWLVVPFLLAVVLYYGLRPLTSRLVLSGMSNESAANIVSLGFLAVLVLAIMLLLPWMTARAVQWEESLDRYLEGGTALLRQTLSALEDRFVVLERARVTETVVGQIGGLTDRFAEKYGATLIIGLGTWIPALLLAPFLAFFFLRDGRRFARFLSRAVPNAFFERTLFLLHEVDRTAHGYFQGLLRLTLLDAAALALGLALLGISSPVVLGLITAVLAWVPYVGSIAGCVLVVLVAATDFPGSPTTAYGAVVLFVIVRMLDDFLFMPMTIGRSLRIHPLLSVLMIFVGGAIAGVPGLMLVLPLLGVVMVIGETVGRIVVDPRLRARHAQARRLRTAQATADLGV
jgi:predicted PurR-regulated permease PerM